MPQWLLQMIAPTLMLWLSALTLSIASTIGPDGMPDRAESAASILQPLVVASWVVSDARKRGRRLCHDYDSFVYFAWPVVVPVYLFQTRGIRALLTLLCFAGIWLLAALTAGAALLARQFAS